jgi:hypothetical protein
VRDILALAVQFPDVGQLGGYFKELKMHLVLLLLIILKENVLQIVEELLLTKDGV